MDHRPDLFSFSRDSENYGESARKTNYRQTSYWVQLTSIVGTRHRSRVQIAGENRRAAGCRW